MVLCKSAYGAAAATAAAVAFGHSFHMRVFGISISWHFSVFRCAFHFSLCPQIVRRRDAFLIASDGKREGRGGSSCTCCRCQFSNWTFVINFNGSVVQSSLAHFSQCTPGVNRAGQDFHSDPSLRFTVLCFPLRCSALLCFVVAHAALLFMWHR